MSTSSTKKAIHDGAGHRRPPQNRPQQNELLTVSDILGDHMKRNEKLKPYQVAATWNRLGKAAQTSHNWGRQTFWIENKEILPFNGQINLMGGRQPQ
jgi:hypothetical protein